MKKLDFYTVRQYANVMGLSASGVYYAIQKGRVQAYKTDNMYLIPKDALMTGRRKRTGETIGISELKKGNLSGFLEKRGYRIE